MTATLARTAGEQRAAEHPLFPRLVRAVAGHESPGRFERLRRTWTAPIFTGPGEHDWYDAGVGGPRWAQYRSGLVSQRGVRLAVRIADDVWPDDPLHVRGRFDDRAAVPYGLARQFARARLSGT